MNSTNPFADFADDLPFEPRVAAQQFKPEVHANPTVARRIPAARPVFAVQPAPLNDDPWPAFAEANPEVAAWIIAKRDSFDFASSLYDAVQRWRTLTPNQLAAAQKCATRDAQRFAPGAGPAVGLGTPQGDRAEAFAAQYPQEVVFVFEQAERGNSFFQSLAQALKQYGSLTERQLAAVQRNLAERAAKQAARGPLSVPTLFDVLQRHANFYAGSLKISRKNGDSLCWLVWNDVCVGKIEDARVVLFAKAAPARAEIEAVLVEFEADPLAAAVKYGRESGCCCSCGRDLTDPASIEAGIGPICAGKFGA